jgi:4-hydroxybenzoate polyprenyltransferase
MLLRPNQWTKNLLVFSPAFFAMQILRLPVILDALFAFIIFCALASGIYIFNDYLDADADRLHTQKRNRPLSAGRISPTRALLICAFLVATGLTGAWLQNDLIFYAALAYVALNVAYSIKLKHLNIIDIFSIALGFVLRVMAGSFAVGLQPSSWIIIMTFLLSLLLAIGKRRDDLLIYLKDGAGPRKSVDGYNLAFIDNCLMIISATVIVCYIVFTMHSETILKFSTNHFYWTAFFVILGIMRYLKLVMVEQRSGDPSAILLQDRCIQISVIGWIAVSGILIYL